MTSAKPSRRTLRALAPFALLGAGVPLAQAQTALVAVTATTPGGQPVASIAPGESVLVTATVSWNGGSQLARLTGDLVAEPLAAPTGPASVGTVTNRFSEFQPSKLVTLGTTIGDDIIGFDAISTPAGLALPFVLPPFGNAGGIIALRHEWIAPTQPGQYEFRFSPSAAWPQVAVYPSLGSIQFVLAQTSFVSAGVTVVPAPAAPLLALAAAIAPRRRRPCIVAG